MIESVLDGLDGVIARTVEADAWLPEQPSNR
jgi:hypothetical protein